MESISNKLSNMKSNFYYETNQSNASKFFKGSILHLSISLEIGVAHFNDKSISFEIICKNIPKRIGSRSSVQNILKEAVLLGFFLKKESLLIVLDVLNYHLKAIKQSRRALRIARRLKKTMKLTGPPPSLRATAHS